MSRQAVNRPFRNGPLRRASAYGAICSAADRAASRAAASRASALGSLSSRDSSAFEITFQVVEEAHASQDSDVFAEDHLIGYYSVRCSNWLKWKSRCNKQGRRGASHLFRPRNPRVLPQSIIHYLLTRILRRAREPRHHIRHCQLMRHRRRFHRHRQPRRRVGQRVNPSGSS
jgi:hypothetical protein